MKISLSAFVAACFSLSINSIKADHLLEYSVALDLTDRFDISKFAASTSITFVFVGTLMTHFFLIFIL